MVSEANSGNAVNYMMSELPPSKKSKINDSDSEHEEVPELSTLDQALNDKYNGAESKASDDLTTDPIPEVLASTLNV